MDASSCGDANQPGNQDPRIPATPLEGGGHESSDSEDAEDSAPGADTDGSPGTAYTLAPAPASGEEAGISERRRPRIPSSDDTTPDETTDGSSSTVGTAPLSPQTKALAIAKENTLLNGLNTRSNKSSRQRSFVDSLTKLTKLGHIKRNSKTGEPSKSVDWEMEVKVKEVDNSSDGDPPSDLPDSPVFERELRQKGEIPNKAARKAAKAAKAAAEVARARKRTNDDFKRRLANGSFQSSTSRSGQSIFEAVSQLEQVVDEVDQLRISRGQLPTNRESRAPSDADHCLEEPSTGEESSGSTRPTRASEELSTNQDPSVSQAGQAPGRLSTNQANNSLATQASDAVEQREGQANSPTSTQTAQASQDSTANRENQIPASRSGPAALGPSDIRLNDNPATENSKDPTSDGDPASDHVVNVQFGIVYDQDPSIAIRSLGLGCGFPIDLPATSESHCHNISHSKLYGSDETEFPAVRVKTLQEISPAQSRQRDKCPDGNDQALSQRGLYSYLTYLLSSLDELGDQLWPVPDDIDSLPGTLCSEELQASDDVAIVPYVREKSDKTCVAKETKEPSKAATFRTGGRCLSGVSSSECLVSPPTKECCTSRKPSLPHSGRDNVPFGKTIEEAYSTYCMAPPTFAPPGQARLTNTVQSVPTHLVDRPCFDVNSITATFGLGGNIDCDSMTRFSRLKSWLCPTSDSECGVKESLDSESICEQKSFTTATSLAQTGCSGAPTDLHVFTPVESADIGFDVASEKLILLPPHGEPSLKEALASRPQDLKVSCSGPTPASPQYTSTRTTVKSSDVGPRTSFEEVLLGMPPVEGELTVDESLVLLPYALKRSCSSSTGLSEQSIITALNESENAVPCKDSSSRAMSFASPAGSTPRESRRVDNFCDTTFKPDTASSVPISQLSESFFQEGPQSLAQKRCGSGLSVITTFSSHSEASRTSKTSSHSGSSSGSSTSSTLPFGLDGTSQRWRPRISKSQASVDIDQGLKTLRVEPLKQSPPESPTTPSGRSGTNAEAMRKFIMKFPPTQPERCTSKDARKQEVRKVVKKRSSLSSFWSSFVDPEKQESEVSRSNAVDVHMEAPGQLYDSSDFGPARLLTGDEEGASPFSESAPAGDVD